MTVYKEIAYKTLIERCNKDEKEAQKLINLLNNDELETYVHINNSINALIDSISKLLELSPSEKEELLDAIYNSEADNPIFQKISELISEQKDKESFVIKILSDIHDDFIKNNSTDEIISMKKENHLLRQYVPFLLIGTNESEKDLVILKPLLDKCGLDVSSLLLDGAYHYNLYYFLKNNNITSFDELSSKLSMGSSFYPVLPENIANEISSSSKDIAHQIYDNWINNDRISAITFLKIIKDYSIKKKEANNSIVGK